MDTSNIPAMDEQAVSGPQPATVPPAADVQVVNTSGQGKTAEVPLEIKHWNWGAFFLTWIWGVGNDTFIALLSFIPLVNVVMMFVLGAKGNTWAWRNRHWDSVEHFKRVQRKWTIAALIFFGVSLAVGVAMGVLVGINVGRQVSLLEQDNTAASSVQQLANTASTTATSSFVFSGTQFVFGDDLSDAQQNYVEYLPEGQTFDTWQSLVTIVRGKALPGTATLSDADADAEATVQDLKGKGASIYKAFTATSTSSGPVDVVIVYFPVPEKSEVDIKKIFLDKDGWIESDTYGVATEGSSTTETADKIKSALAQMDAIESRFIDTQFPQPWN